MRKFLIAASTLLLVSFSQYAAAGLSIEQGTKVSLSCEGACKVTAAFMARTPDQSPEGDAEAAFKMCTNMRMSTHRIIRTWSQPSGRHGNRHYIVLCSDIGAPSSPATP
ncbi:MAG: hypothetical protein AB7T07_04630 [Steroidobacteraceae bacterium]